MNVSAQKYFNTWSAASPAILEFLPARFAICPGAYSDATGKYTEFPFNESMRLMEHQKDGAYVCLKARHAGTDILMEYAKADAYTVLCRYRATKNGEWGLRFWVNVGLGFLDGKGVMQGHMGAYRSYRIAAAFQDAPLRTAHCAQPHDEGRKMEEMGYYAPEIQAENPAWAVAKFNLEETPEIVFAVCVANDEAQAQEKADAALKLDMDALRQKAFAGEAQYEGDFGEATKAIRDVMAWNTLYDAYNHRAFTSLTRFWIDKKFGGWFIWLDDMFYHSLICLAGGDMEMARANLMAALSNACPAGNLACLMSEYTEWVDRSQPPIGAFVAYKYYLFTGDTATLQIAYRQLATSLEWWKANRRTENGLFALGSSGIGSGHFTGTKLAAKDESSMDNSPMYDDAVFDPKTGLMDMNDLAISCLLAVEAEHLALMADVFGEEERAGELRRFAAELKQKIDENLYDESREIYANRRFNGQFAPATPTSFYPLLAGIATGQRQEALLRHMFSEEEFYTYAPFPSVSASHPAARDNVYWRGRVWPPLNFLTHMGLRRMRLDKEAHTIARRSMEIFETGWHNAGRCYENYSAFTGEGRSRDADPFYGWGALIPLMWMLEHIDLDAYSGFHVAASAQSRFMLRDFVIQGKRFDYFVNEHRSELRMNDRQLFVLRSAKGCVRHIEFTAQYMSFIIDAQPFKGADILLPMGVWRRGLMNGADFSLNGEWMKLPPGEELHVELWR